MRTRAVSPLLIKIRFPLQSALTKQKGASEPYGFEDAVAFNGNNHIIGNYVELVFSRTLLCGNRFKSTVPSIPFTFPFSVYCQMAHLPS